MFHAVVFNVTYTNGAFEVKAPWINHSTPSNLELDRAFECAQKAILDAGDGRWTIFKKSKNLYDGDKIQLRVLVPDDVDRYKQYLDVVTCFEAAVAIQLGVAVNTELRTLEDDMPYWQLTPAS